LLDILNKDFQDALHISNAHSALIQFANFIGYFVMAIPAGIMARRFGYKGGILIGLGFSRRPVFDSCLRPTSKQAWRGLIFCLVGTTPAIGCHISATRRPP
jgi:fucose permease